MKAREKNKFHDSMVITIDACALIYSRSLCCFAVSLRGESP